MNAGRVPECGWPQVSARQILLPLTWPMSPGHPVATSEADPCSTPVPYPLTGGGGGED